MAVILVGEIVNSCDAITGFNTGNISGDDDFVEGTGAIGEKISNTTTEMFTTSLGATAPYDFSSSGAESGFHIIMWFNTKTPVDGTTGLRITVGNGTDRGHWYVVPVGFYKGGFITNLVDSARDFDNIASGSWTLAGNPAQLTNITEMGGVFTTTTSIMGNFNNCQLDQFTIGLGVRVDAGSVSTPNTFETVRAADEDTNFWGWWSSSNSAIIGKGKLFIGPETGSTTSVFSDTGFVVIFADERVSSTFYEINTRGSGTDVTWDLASISSANSSSSRWRLVIQTDTNSFSDTNGVWKGSGALSLNANSTLSGTTLIDCNSLTLNGGTVDGITVLNANTTSNNAFLITSNLSNISDSEFNFPGAGHAIEIDTTGTYSFSGNTFSGSWGADESSDASILNSSGGAVTINVTGGGDTPSVRNTSGSTTTVNNTVSITITVKDVNTNPLQGVSVAVFRQSDGLELMNELTDSSGVATEQFNFVSDTDIDIEVRSSSSDPAFFPVSTTGTITVDGFSLTVTLQEDTIIDV